MAFSEELARRIRKAVEHLPVEEKKMFGSLAFLVNGKMCLTAGSERMMCRIDPKLHEQKINRNGCSTVYERSGLQRLRSRTRRKYTERKGH